MMVRPECLVAFSSSVTLKKQTDGGDDFIWFGGLIQFNGLSHKVKFVKVKGPGLIYIDMRQSRNFFKRDQISVYIILLYILLYLTMFLVILLERRDPMPAVDGEESGFSWVNPWLDNCCLLYTSPSPRDRG